MESSAIADVTNECLLAVIVRFCTAFVSNLLLVLNEAQSCVHIKSYMCNCVLLFPWKLFECL